MVRSSLGRLRRWALASTRAGGSWRGGFERPPAVVGALAVGLASGVAVFVLSTTVFAYHSSNHDEAVYLMQAAMLLEGHLELYAGDLTGAVRPWFFVEDGDRLYPKYSPIPAALYAVTMGLVGEPRVTLAVLAGTNVVLVYRLGATVLDTRIGLIAAVVYAAAPLAVVTSAVFLPYMPTTFLHLVFANAYLETLRDRSWPKATLAGVAIGVAFFARPFTAVLFAAPFVVHAAVRIAVSIHEEGLRPLPDPIRFHGMTALGGALFVGMTLAYNLRMTGAALLFPYEAFAPLDGPGFGRRRLLDHSITYTPAVALRANGYVLWHFATRWFTAGPLGTLLAAGGLWVAVRRLRRGDERTDMGPLASQDRAIQRIGTTLLVGVIASITVGNLFFWGNYNILGNPADPTDGILSQFGPFYHFDLLVPLSIFAAVGLAAGWPIVPQGRAWLHRRLASRTATVALVGGLVISLLLVGAVSAAVIGEPVDRNAAHTEKYQVAYEPIEDAAFENALVFLPTPYGDWQHHPFQYLRNDPGLDGPVVYALDRGPENDFAVLDAYPNRTPYRYTYRGTWTPDPDRQVTPTLEPLAVERAPHLEGETAVGVPDRVTHAIVRVETEAGNSTSYRIDDPGDAVRVPWSMDRDRVAINGLDGATVPLVRDAGQTVVMTVTLVQPDGSTLTYRQTAAVRPTADGVAAVWPPERTVCRLVAACGTDGTYLPDEPDAHGDGIWFETRIAP